MKQTLITISILSLAIALSSCNNSSTTSSENQGDSTSFKGKTLNILCWEGYADPAFIKGVKFHYVKTMQQVLELALVN